MLVSIDWMREKYDEYNKMLFDGQLPSIQFKIGRAERNWGYASYRFNLIRGTVTPTFITVSNRYDSPEEVKINTLIHEMIHIYDYTTHPEHFLEKANNRYGGYPYRKRRKYDAHGAWFQSQCERINKFGFNISTSVQTWEEEASKLSDRAQKTLNKKMQKGAIIGFMKEKNGREPWFKIKTDEKGMNEYISTIENYKKHYSNYFYYIEWYITHDEKNCKENNTVKSGWWTSDESKKSQIESNNMQFIKKTIVCDENSQEPKKAKIFKIKTNNGFFTCDARDENKLLSAIKTRFPNMSDEAIKKIMSNPSNYIEESRNNRISRIITEVIDDYVQPNKDEIGKVTTSGEVGKRMFSKYLGDGEYIGAIE